MEVMKTYTKFSPNHFRGGFSLVEVLIGIFVLALGLLGVAAVFPAIVRQQRNATDAVQGVSVQRSVEQVLRGHSELNQADVVTYDANGNQTMNPLGWSLLVGDRSFSANGAWMNPNLLTGSEPSSAGVSVDVRKGDLFVGSTGAWGYVTIPLAERLFPRGFGNGFAGGNGGFSQLNASSAQPRFVWDFVARRVAAGERVVSGDSALANQKRYDDDALQLAVFVRRIDSGIRIPANQTLWSLLTAATPTVVPVAEESTGRPSFDGVGGGTTPRYSTIRSMQLAPVPSTGTGVLLDTVTVAAMDATTTLAVMRPFVEVVGQKFVDSMGLVHEITKVSYGDNPVTPLNPPQLTIDPPLPQSLAVDSSNATTRPWVYFTPQVPASVSVITIRR